MAFSLAPLLVHHEGVSEIARVALRSATLAPPESRGEALEHAARVLYEETDLECRDVRELVGLADGTC
ncbi:MAG TPA: hypothetical protein VH054_04260 [Polyangiaceae bacterium]|jgi:hypothetical protein|nr:hypothetical protein [Polyangiaceae bacterium]